MQVLALVTLNESGEIMSKTPELIAMDNTNKEAVLKFAEDAKEAFKYQNKRLDRKRNFEEVKSLGFVHISELDRLMAEKYIEMEARITIKYRWEKFVNGTWAKVWKQVGKLGFSIYNKMKK